MDLFNTATLLLLLTATFAYLNVRFLRLPDTIGLMVVSLLFSLGLIAGHYVAPARFDPIWQLLHELDFPSLVVDVMLSFLLFAGALHVDTALLRSAWKPIALVALLGVVLSTGLVAGLLYGLLRTLGIEVALIDCLLFGALISPTDPIAVLGILAKADIPKTTEIKIVGESLFNDGIGVVIFLTLLTLVRPDAGPVTAGSVGLLFLQEAGGGLLFGLVVGYGLYTLLKSIDHYQTEVLITLAAVMGMSWLAGWLHVSGPLAVVVAGLLTSERITNAPIRPVTGEYVEKFWELLDILLNALLFVLMGAQLITLTFRWEYVWVSLGAISITLLARYVAIRIPLLISRQGLFSDRRDPLMMTWGGLRGGLSLAMALSIPDTVAQKDLLVFITYGVVLFSILVQGLTLEKLAKRLYR